MKRIEYAAIATLTQAVPASGAKVIEEGEQVTVGKPAGPSAWWVQHRDGRKGVAFIEELEPV